MASTEHGWRSPGTYGPLVAGALLLSAFAAAERRTADPLLPPGFLADRRRATALAAVMATAAGTALTFVLLSLYLQQLRGWSAAPPPPPSCRTRPSCCSPVGSPAR